jgi:hypothetical protein
MWALSLTKNTLMIIRNRKSQRASVSLVVIGGLLFVAGLALGTGAIVTAAIITAAIGAAGALLCFIWEP